MKRLLLAAIVAGLCAGSSSFASDTETAKKLRIAQLEAEIKSSSYGFGTWLKYTVPSTAAALIGVAGSANWIRALASKVNLLQARLKDLNDNDPIIAPVMDAFNAPERADIWNEFQSLNKKGIIACIPGALSVFAWVGVQVLYWHNRAKNNAKVEQLKAELQVLKNQ